jgi:lysophospholipase L1-like esterase
MARKQNTFFSGLAQMMFDVGTSRSGTYPGLSGCAIQVGSSKSCGSIRCLKGTYYTTNVGAPHREVECGSFENQIIRILDYIGEFRSSPNKTREGKHSKRHVAVLTLPPMGEDDLDSPANQLIRDHNNIIQTVVDEMQNDVDRISNFASLRVIPVHERLVSFLQQEQQRPKGILPKVPVDWFLPVSCVQCALYHAFPGMFTWKSLSAPVFGHAIMSDGLHLHETGSDIVADAIVQWDHDLTDRL